MTYEERHHCIDEIALLPSLLETAVSGLSDEQLDTPYREGGWSVRQVVHHIADSHMNGYIRMKLILAEENPTLKPYDQDAWAGLPDYAMPLQGTLTLVRGLHHRWEFMLERVPNSGWNCTAYHPENGIVALQGLLKTYADHGRHHVNQIEQLRERQGWK